MRPCKSSVGLMSDANHFNPCLAQSFGMVKMPLCRRYRDRDQPKVFFQSFSLSPSTVPPSHVLMAKTCMSSCQSICQAAHTRCGLPYSQGDAINNTWPGIDTRHVPSLLAIPCLGTLRRPQLGHRIDHMSSVPTCRCRWGFFLFFFRRFLWSHPKIKSS
ncbi:hypothetical protein LY78DRAFT_366711 [Colletotrichum sublineola]|nr:hypothetical protein LY78DRAFT_366711 [Colletotrichum sublineola]